MTEFCVLQILDRYLSNSQMDSLFLLTEKVEILIILNFKLSK